MVFKIRNEKEKEALLSYVKSLIELNNVFEDKSVDILIKYLDCDMMEVETNQKYYGENAYNSTFVLLNPDEVVAKEIRLPDKHYELVETTVNEDEYIEDWVKMNGNKYAKDEYGQWYDIEEQKALEKMIKGKKK